MRSRGELIHGEVGVHWHKVGRSKMKERVRVYSMTVIVHHYSLILTVHNIIEAASSAPIFAKFYLILFITVVNNQVIS